MFSKIAIAVIAVFAVCYVLIRIVDGFAQPRKSANSARRKRLEKRRRRDEDSDDEDFDDDDEFDDGDGEDEK